ncbi:MAG: hypothetical protein NUK63_03290 [Candidatus Bathyarchaeum tardum]|nr:MAG: hypothetical protein NUK63_03290 [Candidatus Bathyarchaeum tardum]
MSGLIQRIREGVSRNSNSLLPAHRTIYGEPKPVTFNNILTAYTRDPSCKAFVDFLADQAVGMGFYTTVNEQYEKATEAKQAIDKFCETVNLDSLLQIGAREIVAAGNSFWLKTTPENLQILKVLPLTGFDESKAVERDFFGEVTGYNYSYGEVKKKFKPEKIIHFRWNPVNFSAFGTGVLQVLLSELKLEGGETRISFLEMKARIEKMMPEVFEKYAGPDELWVFAGASDKKLAEYQKMIKNKPKAGARFVYNKPEADIKTVSVDPRARYEAYIDHILNQVYLGGQTPLPKLFTTPGFTEASARAALEIAERKVLALQRFIKRTVEKEIFVPVLTQAGLDPVKADSRMNWGIPEKPDIETLLPVLAQIAKDRSDVIPTPEFRKILITMGLPLENKNQNTRG